MNPMIFITSSMITFVIIGCAHNAAIKPTNIQNSKTYTISNDKIWKNAIRILALQGFPIQNSNKETGVISTSEKTIKLTGEQADCGNILGLAYLKDERTSTTVSYSVFIESQGQATKVTVNTEIKGLFNSHAGSTTKVLSCFSKGSLEVDFLSSLEK